MRRLKTAPSVLIHAAIAVAFASFSTVVRAQQRPAAELPFARGEQLLYKAELNRGLLRGVDIGELRFAAKLDADKNVSLVGDAVSKGFLIRITGNHFHMHFESIADAQPFAALRTRSMYKDKRTTINSEATFDQTAGKAIWTESEENEKPIATTLSIESPAHDVLSLIYFVRTQNLKPGQTFEVSMVDSGRSYRCVVNVLSGKRMGTAVGRVNTIRVEPAIYDGDRVVRPRGMMTLWMTDDARHLPVKAQIRVPIGNVDINLKRVTYQAPVVARN